MLALKQNATKPNHRFRRRATPIHRRGCRKSTRMLKSQAPYAPQATRSAFGEAELFEVLAAPPKGKRRFPPGKEPFLSWRLSSASRYRLRRFHARLAQKTTPPPIARPPPYRRSEGKRTRRRNKRGNPQQAPWANNPPIPGLFSLFTLIPHGIWKA